MIQTLEQALTAPDDLPWGVWRLLPKLRPPPPMTPCHPENLDDLRPLTSRGGGVPGPGAHQVVDHDLGLIVRQVVGLNADADRNAVDALLGHVRLELEIENRNGA